METWSTATCVNTIDRGLHWWDPQILNIGRTHQPTNLLHALSVTGDLQCMSARLRNMWISKCIAATAATDDEFPDILADFDTVTVAKILDMVVLHHMNRRAANATEMCLLLDDLERRTNAARKSRKLLQLTQ